MSHIPSRCRRSITNKNDSVGPLLTSLYLPLIMEFHVGFTDISLLTGYQLCAVGAVGIIVSACARKYGKRTTALWSMSCAFAGSIWGGRAQSYGSMVGARVLQGLGIAMFESVTFAVIGDLYYVHQRGTRMTLYILAQSGLSSFPSMIAGKIAEDLGWRYVFYLLDIFMGLGWLAIIFFGYETVYNRKAIYNLDTNSQDVS
jgi:MFS family permease